jgi:hypothetical protein
MLCWNGFRSLNYVDFIIATTDYSIDITRTRKKKRSALFRSDFLGNHDTLRIFDLDRRILSN